MTKFNKNYSIGLDIGVSSVGYAVVTEDYRVPAFKFKVLGNTEKEKIKKNLIGSTTFVSAQPAKGTRVFRVNRRRIDRRNHRITYLRDIFQKEIEKVDKNFYRRLDESFRVLGDKSEDLQIKQPFFGDKELETAYHKKYPTIYHLRKHLADADKNSPVADIREVYMAISHILKYRGHFLTLDKINPNNINMQNSWIDFIESCQEVFDLEISDESKNIADIFKSSENRQEKVKKILPYFQQELLKKDKSIFKQLLQLLFGLKTKFKDCFELEEEPDLNFSKENYDENLENFLGSLEEDFSDVFAKLKVLRDTILLSGMLTYTGATHARFSATMVERYEEHRKDLQRFKFFIKQNLSEQDYLDIFGRKTQNGFDVDKETKGYVGYITNKMVLTNPQKQKTIQQNFYDYISGKITGIEGAEYFLNKISDGTFLRKLRTSDNGAIPNQIHAYELEKIIERQGKDYPFLLENKDKLLSILTFKIPYYVGPLAKGSNSRFAWIKRATSSDILDDNDEDTRNGKIRPWNYQKLINMDETRDAFITNLIGNDIILLNEKVLPKRSLIYEEVMLQNELTRVKYKDKYGKAHFFDSELRQNIINGLFKNNSKRVNAKSLIKYLSDNHKDLNAIEIVSGVEKGKSFNSTLKTYNDLKTIFSEELLDSEIYQKELEEIIKVITVFDDKKSIKNYLTKFFGHLEILDEEKINQLSKLRYSGWGRYSAKLLLDIRDEDTGFNLLQFLRNDEENRNLTKLISDNTLSFEPKIKDIQSKSTIEDDIFDEIKKLAGSPAIKRGILNSIKIVDELVQIIGYPPHNIVIEMARENMTTEEGQKKAKTRKTKLESALKNIENSLLENGKVPHSDEQLQSEKLYLYYLQNGKALCLDTSIYGGYGPMNSALSIIIIAERFNEKKGKIETVKEFHDIFIIDYEKFNNNPFQFLNDTSENGFLKKNNINRVLGFYRIPKYSLMQKIDGTRMLFESKSNLHKATQFKLTKTQNELFFHMKRLLTKSNLMDLKSKSAIKESQNFILKHKEEFDNISNQLSAFSQKMLGNTTSLKNLIKGYNERKIKEIDIRDETIKYFYDNFIKMFSFVKSGAPKDINDFFDNKCTVARMRPKPDKKLLNATLIHQSITGLYETRIDLSKLGED